MGHIKEICSPAQLQECLINLLTYFLTVRVLFYQAACTHIWNLACSNVVNIKSDIKGYF